MGLGISCSLVSITSHGRYQLQPCQHQPWRGTSIQHTSCVGADISAHSPLRTTPAKRPCLYRHWHHHHLRTILLTNMLPWWMVPMPLMASLLRGAQHYSFPHLRCTGIMRGNLCSMSASLHQPAVLCMHKQDTACMSRALHAFTSTWLDGWPAGWQWLGSHWDLATALDSRPPAPPGDAVVAAHSGGTTVTTESQRQRYDAAPAALPA